MKTNHRKQLMGFILIVMILASCTIGLLVSQTQFSFAYAQSQNEMDAKSLSNTTDLKFTLYTNVENGNQEYKVSALNRNLIEAKIPEEYENIPVTEVADNAFTNCQQLTYIKVPSSIKRIGNSAFLNCSRLEKVVGMTNVKVLGNSVFSRCTALKDLILPAKLDYVGASILKGVQNDVYSRRSATEMTAMNSEWDTGRSESSRLIFGNKLVCDDVVENDVVVGYEIRECQNLAPDEDFIVYSSWKRNENEEYLPIVNIKKSAFEFNVFSSLTIKHDPSLPYNHSININSAAFSNVTADSINIEVDITLLDPNEKDTAIVESERGTALNVFEWTQVNTITLPASLNRLTRSMFTWSTVSKIKSTDSNITDNHLSSSITRIDSMAFESTYNLEHLYLPSTIAIMGESVFNDWGNGDKFDKQNIHIDMAEIPQGWVNGWDIGINYEKANAIFEKAKETYEITFDKQNGTSGSNIVMAEYDKAMPTAIAPTRQNYVFQGYYSGVNGSGIKYYNADMTNAHNWDKKAAATLYAYWKGVESTITFDKQDGINGSGIVKAEFGAAMPTAIAPTKNNFNFKGYFSEPNGQGTMYYNENMNSVCDWDKTVNTTLYAHWTGIPSIIKFDQQNGVGGSQEAIGIYGETMPTENSYGKLIAPTRQNYIFQGYFTEPKGKGTKFYDAIMNSTNTWDKTTSTTLYASWKGVDCTIVFDKNGGSGGSDFVIVEYGEILPQNLIAPTKVGFTFTAYYFEDSIIFDYNMNSQRKWETAGTVKLLADWKNKKYTVKLDPQGGEISKQNVVAIYDEPMSFTTAPTRVGYVFLGFFTELNGKGIKYYNSDMSSANNWDIDENNVTLYADWDFGTYKITVNPQGGIIKNENDFFYASYSKEMPLNIPTPELKGHYLKGLYTKPNGEGFQYYSFGYAIQYNLYTLSYCDILSNCFFTENSTLYAYYEPMEYTININFYDAETKTSFAKTSQYTLKYGESFVYNATSINGYTYKYCTRSCRYGSQHFSEQYTDSTAISISAFHEAAAVQAYNLYYAKACIAEGTMITLADGSQVPVEKLTGNEQLLVWNLKTGTFDTAPILFIDHDEKMNYEVINLEFSDGTTVKVISEHAFWDFDLNKYVFLRRDAAQYIGHWFNKQIQDENGNMTWTKVQLIGVNISKEYTSAWSPVTYEHLCYYVNGMLSMPGETKGLINIFKVDNDTLQINYESFQADIEKYGIFTYEEFSAMYPIPKEIFDAFNVPYLKVSLGKGLITQEQLGCLIEKYAKFFA